MTIILFVAGIALLVVGAEALVRGAARIAVTAGISPLVVGLTVVAFGTSSPELAVTISSSTGGDPDIAIGNIVGSNILNTLLILGASAVITPLVVSQRLVRREVPLMIAVSVVVFPFALDGRVDRLEGLVLAGGVVVYTAWAIWNSRREHQLIQAEYAAEFSARERTLAGIALDVVLVVGGLGLLVLGSNWFVDGAVDIADALGVSQLVIGLTIVALGTSMPEVATSIMASLRGERDIAVGNVVGSNLFNILAVLGITSVVADGGVAVADAALRFDIPVMIATAVACLPIFFTGWAIVRWEGLLFLGYYVAYTAYLLLDASGHDALPAYSFVMLVFVVPLTAVTLAVLAFRHHRLERAARQTHRRR
ncbi:MAG: calcium/sodium antiporter [Dehalococcoidia bacterium]